MIHINFYLHSFTSVKGASSLYVRVHADGMYELAASTHERIARANWNHPKQMVKKGEEFAHEINQRIDRIKTKIAKEFRERLDDGQELSVDILRDIIRPGAMLNSAEKKRSKRTMPGHAGTPQQVYDEWKARYMAHYNEGRAVALETTPSVDRHRQVVNWLAKFEPNMKVANLTPEKVLEYRRWLIANTGIQDSTISNHISTIRMLMEQVGKNPKTIIVPKSTKATKYDLYWDEVQKLINTKYSDVELQEAAHAFAINCQLCLRFQDTYKVNEHSLLKIKTLKHGDCRAINLNQGKTGDPILIPAPPMAAGLLERYGWRIPMPIQVKRVSANNKYGKLIKKAAEEAKLDRKVRVTRSRNGHVTETFVPLYKVISAHDVRHTGKTRIQEITKNKDLADALLGHAGNDTYSHVNPIMLVDDLLDAWSLVDK